MGTGILICGLNGGGKSTLGKALAEKIGFHFIDNEDLFFPTKHDYSIVNSKEEVINLLMKEISINPNFIFAAVKGDYGTKLAEFLDYIIVIDVPKEIRTERVRNRSLQKFGDRMLKGGDLYESEEEFFNMVNARDDSFVENYLNTTNSKIIRVDGTKDINENADYIVGVLRNFGVRL